MKIIDYIKLFWIFKKTESAIKWEVKNMNDDKKWYKSKTVWFNIVSGGIAIATALQNSALASDPKVQAGVALFITLGNVALRFVTEEAIK